MNIYDKLRAEDIAYQIIYSHDLIDERYDKDIDKKRALATWRLEIYDWTSSASKLELQHALKILRQESSTTYLEVLLLVNELQEELKEPVNIFDSYGIRMWTRLYTIVSSIINKINLRKYNKGDNNEKICDSCTTRIERNCNDYGDTGPSTGPGTVQI